MRISDWSSDVCSSDLVALPPLSEIRPFLFRHVQAQFAASPQAILGCLSPFMLTHPSRLYFRETRAEGAAHISFVAHLPQHLMQHDPVGTRHPACLRSAEHTSELQSIMRISYAAYGLKKKNIQLIHKDY